LRAETDMSNPTAEFLGHMDFKGIAPNMPSRSRRRILAPTSMLTLRVNRRLTTPRASARTSHRPSKSSPTRTPSSRAAPMSANAMSSYVSSRRSTRTTRRLCLTISMPSLTKGCPPQSKSHSETPFMTSVAQPWPLAQRRTSFPSSVMTLA